MVTSRREAAKEDEEDIIQINDRFGNCYQGSVLDGKPHGKGVILWSSGARYVGDMVQGEMEGAGRLQWPDGSTYSGQWQRSSMHGQGKLELAGDGGSYEGGFAAGLFHGKGYRRFANGDEYRGFFCEGQLHGMGEYVHKATGWRCHAEWEAGDVCGMGRAYWADGLQYVGQWLHGKPEGYGSLLWPNGTTYEGDMANGLPHGFGTKQFVNGARYIGLFSLGDILHQPNSSGSGSNSMPQRLGSPATPTSSSPTGLASTSRRANTALPTPAPQPGAAGPPCCARDPEHVVEVQQALLAMSLRRRGGATAAVARAGVHAGAGHRDEERQERDKESREERAAKGGADAWALNPPILQNNFPSGRSAQADASGNIIYATKAQGNQCRPLPPLLRDERGFPLSILEYPDGSWFQGYLARGSPLPGPGRRVFENGASLEGTFVASTPAPPVGNSSSASSNPGGDGGGATSRRSVGRRTSMASSAANATLGAPSGLSPAAAVPPAASTGGLSASGGAGATAPGANSPASPAESRRPSVSKSSASVSASSSSLRNAAVAASGSRTAAVSGAVAPATPTGTVTERASGNIVAVSSGAASPSGLSAVAPRAGLARLVLSGEGVRCWADGSSYEGMMQDGRPVGKGRFMWGSGEDVWSFVGRVGEDSGVVEGRGKLTWRSAEHGRCTYEGDFQQGVFHGQGEVHFGSGGWYRGDFYHGMYHGLGTFTWPSGLYGDGLSCSYTGSWARDQMQGQGRLDWVDGDYLEGTFKDSQLAKGKGRRTLACGDVCEGGWVAGNLHGYAEYNWKDGSYYLGGVDRGKHSGYGKKVWASGEMYVGHFVHGQEDGQGVLFDKLRRRRVLGRWKAGTLAEEIVEKVCDPTSDGTVYLDMSSGSAKPWGGGTGHAIVLYTKKGEEGVFVGTLEGGRRDGAGILLDAMEVASIGQWCQDELQRTADCLYGQ